MNIQGFKALRRAARKAGMSRFHDSGLEAIAEMGEVWAWAAAYFREEAAEVARQEREVIASRRERYASKTGA